MNELEMLTRLYEASALPTVIFDSDYKAVCENASYKKSKNSRADGVAAMKPGASGIYRFSSGREIVTYNIIIPENSGYIIAELVKRDNIEEFISNSQIRGYLEYVFARIREAVGSVCVAADDIYAFISELSDAPDAAVSRLNTINDSILSVLNEIVTPEALACFSAEDDEKTVCLTDIVEKEAVGAEKLLPRVKVKSDAEQGIFARINRRLLDIILADMAYRCVNSEREPDTLVFGLKRIEESVELSAGVSYRAVKNPKYKADSAETPVKSLLSEYAVDLFCRRYGSEYTRLEKENGLTLKLTFPSFEHSKPLISVSRGFEQINFRFAPMALRFADYGEDKRYRSEKPAFANIL